jgi:hypothetical protein
MHFSIEAQSGYFKAEMIERETAAETAQFVEAIVTVLREGRVTRLLVSLRRSRPVFKVEDWNLSAALDQVMAIPDLRVAFISDTRELGMSQDYIAFLARQRGLRFEAFATEQAAVAWLQRL